jgi:cyclic beta-1,2-glucan synthetase
LSRRSKQEITFSLGYAQNEKIFKHLLKHIQGTNFNRVFEVQKQCWTNFSSRFQGKPHDPSFDLLVNQWLPSYSSRILARAAFYKASGAYGFRDQLQDTLSFLLIYPNLARKQFIQSAVSLSKATRIQAQV